MMKQYCIGVVISLMVINVLASTDLQTESGENDDKISPSKSNVTDTSRSRRYYQPRRLRSQYESNGGSQNASDDGEQPDNGSDKPEDYQYDNNQGPKGRNGNAKPLRIEDDKPNTQTQHKYDMYRARKSSQEINNPSGGVQSRESENRSSEGHGRKRFGGSQGDQSGRKQSVTKRGDQSSSFANMTPTRQGDDSTHMSGGKGSSQERVEEDTKEVSNPESQMKTMNMKKPQAIGLKKWPKGPGSHSPSLKEKVWNLT